MAKRITKPAPGRHVHAAGLAVVRQVRFKGARVQVQLDMVGRVEADALAELLALTRADPPGGPAEVHVTIAAGPAPLFDGPADAAGR